MLYNISIENNKGDKIMDKTTLKIRQNLDLETKLFFTKNSIQSFIDTLGEDKIYIAYSGGKDSTVLAHISKSMGYDIPLVFVNTRNEFKSIIDQINYMKNNGYNVIQLLPKLTPKQVIEEYGYPVISKPVSNTIYYARKNIKEGKNTLRVRQIMGLENGSKFNKGKWKFLLDSNIKISDKCCNELKKKPLKSFEKETKKRPIIGTMACESMTREQAYLKHGCNKLTEGKEQCTPLGFWTEKDIYEYIEKYNVKIADIYKTESRTGCVACAFGMEFDKYRFKRLKEIEPKKYNYVINTLGYNKVCDILGYEY